MSARTKTNRPARRTRGTPSREPTQDEIAACARSIWEAEGRPHGRDLEHWLMAEARLRHAETSGPKARPPAQPVNPPATPSGRTTRKP
jgi:hypothetical protein